MYGYEHDLFTLVKTLNSSNRNKFLITEKDRLHNRKLGVFSVETSKFHIAIAIDAYKRVIDETKKELSELLGCTVKQIRNLMKNQQLRSHITAMHDNFEKYTNLSDFCQARTERIQELYDFVNDKIYNYGYEIKNSVSNDEFKAYCKENNIKISLM